jgi:hypothetical protein
VPAATIGTTDFVFTFGVQEEEEEEEAYLEGIEKLIQDLSSSDNAIVNAALDALFLDLDTNAEKRDSVTVWGGCAALVHLLKFRLEKAANKISRCDQVKESNE